MLCGIDLGSRCVKIVIMNDGQICRTEMLETVEFYRRYGRRLEGQLVVDFDSLGLGGLDALVATGYGRNTLNIAGATVIPELKAHMLGAIWQLGIKDFTLLDLGGQDSKVIKVHNGRMAGFQTNDKCAASTGRYLENMATVLDVTVDDLSCYSENPVALDATCAIFGESELIGRIIEGYSVPELAAGVNHAIFRRIRPMLGKLLSETVVFTGGVALSGALKRIIEQELAVRVVVPEYPQFNGAIGCAVYAREAMDKHVAGN